MEPKGKTALVTGGAKGLGELTVQRLVDEGARVCVFDVATSALSALRERLPMVITVPCDISNAEAVESAVNAFCDKHGPIDILINNAAIVHSEALVGFTSDGLTRHAVGTWDRVLSTNLSGTFYVSRSIVHVMTARRIKGVIVNISSIAAAGNAGQSAYSATKAAVNALTVCWAKELAPLGIRVAGLAPGFAATETTMSSMPAPLLLEWKKRTPVHRLADPREVVDGILFVIRNDFYNGRILEIDGGLRL